MARGFMFSVEDHGCTALGDLVVGLDGEVDVVDVDEPVAVGARHAVVDLGDDDLRVVDGGARNLRRRDRRTEHAAGASAVRLRAHAALRYVCSDRSDFAMRSYRTTFTVAARFMQY